MRMSMSESRPSLKPIQEQEFTSAWFYYFCFARIDQFTFMKNETSQARWRPYLVTPVPKIEEVFHILVETSVMLKL